MGALSCFQSLFGNNPHEDLPGLPATTCARHDPPPGYAAAADNRSSSSSSYYADNPTVFGRILDGTLPCRTYRESAGLLAFRDKHPRADLHALVIPKRHVKSVYSLSPSSHDIDIDDDVGLVRDMRRMGLELLEKEMPTALASDDYVMCFHIPPFYSVDHLHLHVLAPASGMSFVNREIKFRVGARWCVGDVDVIERLERGMPAVPYRRPF